MSPPRARRFGVVNLYGAWTLYRRDMMRSMEIWGITILAPAFQAVLFALAFKLVLGEVSLTMGGMDFENFLAPGLIAATVLARAFESTGFFMVYDKLEGMVIDLVAAPLTPAETVTGYGLMSASTAVITGAATGLALSPFISVAPQAPLVLVAFAFLGGLMTGLTGLAAGLWADKWDHITAAQTFVVIPAIYLSGVFFSLDRLTGPFAAIARLNPVYFVIDGMRYGMTGHAEVEPLSGLAAVLAVDAALWLLCWRLVASGYKLKA